jgi:4a-hydroxytetrahydrobiopterin dehydratase
MEKLSSERIDEYLADLPQWSRNGDLLQRTLGFDDFNGAISFVNRLRDLAEGMQHHPDIMIRYNKVTLTLTTHDSGGITEKDFDFARATDGCLAAP